MNGNNPINFQSDGCGCDDAPQPIDVTDERCPFCDHFVETDGDVMFCRDCLITWRTAADLARDREQADIVYWAGVEEDYARGLR